MNLVDPQGDSTTVYLARNAVAGAGHIAVAVSYSDHPQSDEQYLWSRNGERNERGKTLFGRTVGGIDDEGTAITSDVQEFLNTNTKDGERYYTDAIVIQTTPDQEKKIVESMSRSLKRIIISL